MGALFSYSLQSAICLTVFYLFYKALLSRDTFHHFNRAALLSILALSLIIPLMPAISATKIAITGDSAFPLAIPDIQNFITADSTNSYLPHLLLIYLTGCVICLIFTLANIIKVMQIIHKGKHMENNIIIVADDIQSFSWLRYIVISQHDREDAGDAIIAHEQAHVNRYHSFDLIVTQLYLVVQWFNPAAWLLYRDMQSVHEYESDAEVLNRGFNLRQYQLLIIKKSVGARLYSIANSFNTNNNLIKRITMMTKKESSMFARLKYAYVLPLAAATVAAFAHPAISNCFADISSAEISHLDLFAGQNEVEMPDQPDVRQEPSYVNPDDSVFRTVEVMPEFPGGDVALLKFIEKNINVPADKWTNGHVACTFVVNEDGSVSDVSVVRSLDPVLDAEAVRVIKLLPKFKPGMNAGKPVKTMFSIPIRFKVTNGDKKPVSKDILDL